MNILAFTDTHGNSRAKEAVKKKAAKADLVVCAGDFTVFGRGTGKELEWMNALGRPVMLVHGNHEDEAEVRKICAHLDNVSFIHKKQQQYKDYVFVGYGGDGFSLIDKKFAAFARQLRLPKNRKIIFVSHQPPHRTKLDYIWDHHGNKSYREFITRKQPALAISGHLHETAGKEDRLGKTRLVNPGPFGKLLRV